MNKVAYNKYNGVEYDTRKTCALRAQLVIFITLVCLCIYYLRILICILIIIFITFVLRSPISIQSLPFNKKIIDPRL